MQEEFCSGVESESRDEDIEGMRSLGLLNLDIALHRLTSSMYVLQRERDRWSDGKQGFGRVQVAGT